MLIRIRRCIASDDGVTVVETMFAIMVLAIALFGLMGSLIASAESQLDQRRRTQGIRVANEFLETRREAGFDKLKDDLLAGCPAGSTCAPSTKTVGGVTYTITPTVTEVDPTNPTLGPQPGKATVMQVNTRVSWEVRGQLRNSQFSTVVSPTKPDLTKDIKSITVFPDPLVVSKTSDTDVNPWGQPTQDVQLTVELKGLPMSTPVSVSWVDDQGAKGPFSLTSTDGKSWQRTIARTNIRKIIPGMGTTTTEDDEDFGELEFRFAVDIGGGVTLQQQQTVRLARAVNPPVITKPGKQSPTVIKPDSFSLVRTGPQSGRGRNIGEVVFSAEVNGLNFNDDGTTSDTVIAYWQDSGVWVSAPLTWSTTAYTSATNGTFPAYTWRRVIPDKGQIFPTNVSTLNVYIQATRASDGANSYVTIPVTLS